MYQKNVGCSKAKMHECLSDLHEADDEEGDRKSRVKGALARCERLGSFSGSGTEEQKGGRRFLLVFIKLEAKQQRRVTRCWRDQGLDRKLASRQIGA
jgi:hypothetical protein